VLSSGGAASGLRLERTALEPAPGGGGQRAVATGEHEALPAQLVLESIGYRSLAVAGVAFDPGPSVIPNRLGQVLLPRGAGAEGGAPAGIDPGLFVCGWLKRGPTGIIGTNLVDAEQTVDTMVCARGTFPPPAAAAAGGEGLRALLRQRGVRVVTAQGWAAIDAAEVGRGRAAGKAREKFVSVEEMLRVAEKAQGEG
jgi:adrenodoxin-NADP+ reductase